MAALWQHPQLAARSRWREFGSSAGPLPGLLPISGEGWEPRFDPVPAIGEHTARILAEFGLAQTGEEPTS
jgi:itaconate CoA-transferase